MNETAGCTKQAFTFRDHCQDFTDVGAEEIGISSDTDTSDSSFSNRHKLPFILRSDKDGLLRKQFGAPSGMLGLLPGRVTYIIDKQGIIQHTFNSRITITKTLVKLCGY